MPAYKHSSHKKEKTAEQILEDRVAHISRIRKADAAAAAPKKKRGTWVSRLKEDVGILTKGVKHSKAGKKYLAKSKKKKPPKGKKIAYYGQGRETADDILRRLKRKK